MVSKPPQDSGQPVSCQMWNIKHAGGHFEIISRTFATFPFFKINSSSLEDSQANLKCDKRVFLCYGKFELLIFTTNEVNLS